MDKFTQGPWHVGNGDIYADGTSASDFDDIVIAAIGQSGGFRSHEYSVVKAHKPEGKANARLIAAAPDLLALVHQYRNDMLYPPTTDSRERRISAIDAVLKKIGEME